MICLILSSLVVGVINLIKEIPNFLSASLNCFSSLTSLERSTQISASTPDLLAFYANFSIPYINILLRYPIKHMPKSELCDLSFSEM